MRSYSRLLLILPLLASAPFARAQSPKPADARKTAEAPKPGDPPKTFDLEAIDAYVAAQVREQGYPGLSLTIVRDGKVVLAKGYGKRSLEDGAPVEPDTPFAVGSVTKQFTCACILLLAEEGKLSVDDKVAKYYPELDQCRRYLALRPDDPHLGICRLLSARLRRPPAARSRSSRRPAGGVRRGQARLRAGRALVVQQYRLHAPGPCGREGQREAVRPVPQGADSRPAGHDAFGLRAGTRT